MQTPCSDPIAVLLISREERPLPEASRGLEKEGFRIRRISEWRALQCPPLESPDLIILDLPDRNRDSLLPCAEIRKRFCGPLLVLADAAGEAFHILGLELGADDVMEKPVSHALLSAKLKSLLRRHHRPGGEIAVLRHGDLSLDRSRREVRLAGALVTLTPQARTDREAAADAVVRTADSTSKPIIASFMGEARVRSAIGKLKAGSIPNFSFPELAVKSFQRLATYRAWRNTTTEETANCWRNIEAARQTVAALLKTGTLQAGEDEAMQILAYYGFRFPKRTLVRTSREAGRAASEIGFPLVMKISSPDILHKTDVGGVRVNVRTAREAEDAFTEITSNARRIMRDAFIKGVMLYEMVQGGKEVILGVTYDRTFGHMLMFGLGGIYVEVLKDVSFRIAPVTRRDALAMVADIKTAGLLRGARGERPVSVDAIAGALVNLSCLVSDFPDIRELDINPLMATEQDAVALDARIIFKQPEDKEVKLSRRLP